ncbi:MAG: triose-phosphate isomerase, partial [Candidatus Krumholzibacteria bacterium]|nr:triose-phosphate isomerase [Candidatus Krumholzibacteria bacterium]
MTIPRKKLIAANWKMQKLIAEAETFGAGLKAALGSMPDRDLLVFPPFLALPATARIFEGTRVAVGAQDLFWEKQGAFTGEISGDMIMEAGGTHVIVGHSERRHVMGESNDIVTKKLESAMRCGLTAVFCVGERLEDREAGQAEDYVRGQLASAFTGVSRGEMSSIVIAYEPVWAIGTGKTATAQDAEHMHRFIRGYVSQSVDEDAAEEIRVLYGGSVKPDNASSLLQRSEIDGVLIGGA